MICQFFLISCVLHISNFFTHHSTIFLFYVKTIIFEVDKQKWWDERVSDDDKKFIKSLPYFDAEIFYECVGIRIK